MARTCLVGSLDTQRSGHTFFEVAKVEREHFIFRMPLYELHPDRTTGGAFLLLRMHRNCKDTQWQTMHCKKKNGYRCLPQHDPARDGPCQIQEERLTLGKRGTK